MDVLVIGLFIFLGTHSISIIHPAWRDRMVHEIGEWPWKGIYSLFAIIGFVLIVWGYGLARYDPVVLYTPPVWLRHTSLVLLLFVFPLLLATYLPGRIKSAIQHPMLAATKVWAFAHLLANGNLADVVLFGSILVWAIADRLSMKRRQPRAIPAAPPAKWNDVIAVVGGLGLYLAFALWLHEWLLGLGPFY